MVEASISVLNNIRDLGIAVALDDFGTGYSSLSYLQRFPLDYVKIDRSFVRDIETSQDDENLIRAIIAMSHSLSLPVIAEGVEEEGQCRILQLHHVDKLQGYLFSRPLPDEEFTRLLRGPNPFASCFTRS
jgi:EAL domain-containing protein (putative c-di-GMP-specific phosphodiesterase class I)